MKLKIKNPKLLSLILSNAILLTQSGCFLKNTDDYKEPVTIESSQDLIDDNNQVDLSGVENNQIESNMIIEPTKEPIIIKKCNNNVCSNKTVFIKKKYKSDSKVIMKVGEFQKLREIAKTNNGWSLVKYKADKKEVKGYVKSKNLSKLGKKYIEIDISDQIMTYYKNNKKALSTYVVTGKDSTPTKTGLFKVYSKNTNYTMRGEDYTAFSRYVLKYFGAYYIHDALWRSSFGGSIYHQSGSHGCVNTPYSKMKELFNETKINTKVLIHK